MGNSSRTVEKNVSLYVGKQPQARERISQLLEKVQSHLLRTGPIGYGTLSKADKRLFKLILKGYNLEWPYYAVSRLLEMDTSFSCSLVEGSTAEQLKPPSFKASCLEERKLFVVGVITPQPRVPEVFSQTPSYVDGSLYFADGTGTVPCVVVRACLHVTSIIIIHQCVTVIPHSHHMCAIPWALCVCIPLKSLCSSHAQRMSVCAAAADGDSMDHFLVYLSP